MLITHNMIEKKLLFKTQCICLKTLVQKYEIDTEGESLKATSTLVNFLPHTNHGSYENIDQCEGETLNAASKLVGSISCIMALAD